MILSKIKISKVFSVIANAFKNISEKRKANSEKYKKLNIFLSIFFPIFIVCMAEINQLKYVDKFFLFVASKPGIFLFDIIISALIFTTLYLIFKHGWLAMLAQSVLYMVLSISELFKYNTNGNHLTVTDMSLAKSLESLMSFAYIKITLMLVIYIAIILIYIGVAFWFNPTINRKFFKSIIPALCCIGVCVAIMFIPPVGNAVYSVFGIETKASKNTFILNEKFNENGFLAFFMQDGTETVENALKEPENYSANTVKAYTSDKSTKYQPDKSKKSPNVVVIMSESYADFRGFDDKLHIDKNVYKSFDEVCNDSFAKSGYAIVPTYASYTVRTEFELMFGLPVKSLNDPYMPQRLLLDRKQDTIPSYYKANGYSTYYVHPYLSSFYGREYIYSNYSFDKMIFEKDFDVSTKKYGENEYVDDASTFDEDLYLIKNTDKPVYIHTTTMQNHQPYGGDTSNEQFQTYLDGIEHTGDALKEFTYELKKLDEPTIVFYIGDHYPSLRGEDSIYTQLGITSNNCSELYEQHYVIWANYDVDFDDVPKNEISTFYMPYVLMNMSGVSGDGFTAAMNKKMKNLPIYSTNYDPDSKNDNKLDVLTYDRVLGDQDSPSPLKYLYPNEETSTVESKHFKFSNKN